MKRPRPSRSHARPPGWTGQPRREVEVEEGRGRVGEGREGVLLLWTQLTEEGSAERVRISPSDQGFDRSIILRDPLVVVEEGRA